MTFDLCLIVPCYNEESRLPVDSFRRFLQGNRRIMLAFVNDGSTDSTARVLRALAGDAPNALVIDLEANQGKGNAVHAGMAACLPTVDAAFFGYWDSDLATPLESIFDFLKVFEDHESIEMVTGCRLKRLGADIKRSLPRHYMGRVFATLASTCLNLPVYDTQCGAKVFRRNLASFLFTSPFISRWIFDVEIYFRIKKSYIRQSQDIIYELTLKKWINTKGSKVNFFSYLSSAIDLLRLLHYYQIKK